MAKKPAVVVIEEEEEEETPKVSRKKVVAEAVSPGKAKKSKDPERSNGKAVVVAKAGAPQKGVVPAAFKREGPSARDFVTRVLVAGAPRAEVKKRAQALAAKEGADVSFKTFDVSFFIKHLTDKLNYTVVEKKDGSIKATAPKA